MDAQEKKGCFLLIAIAVVLIVINGLVQKNPKIFPDAAVFYDIVSDTAAFYVLGVDTLRTGIKVYRFGGDSLVPDTVFRVYKGNEPVSDLKFVPLYDGQWIITGEKNGYDFWFLTDENFTLKQVFYVPCKILNAIPYTDGFAVVYGLYDYKCKEAFGDYDYAVECYDYDGNFKKRHSFTKMNFDVVSLLFVYSQCDSFMFLTDNFPGNCVFMKLKFDTMAFKPVGQGCDKAFISDTLVLVEQYDRLKIYDRRSGLSVFDTLRITLWDDLVFARVRDSVLIYVLDNFTNAKKVKLIDLVTGKKDYFRISGEPWVYAADIYRGKVVAVGSDGLAILAEYKLKYKRFKRFYKTRKHSGLWHMLSPVYRLFGL